MHLEKLQEQLQAMPRRLEKLRKSGLKKMSRTDEEARFLRERSGFVLGYTAEAAVNEDHLIVGQRVTQNAADNHSLIPMVEEAERQSGAKAEKILADAGFFSLENVEELESRGLDVYLPDSNLARELNTGQRCSRIRLSQTQRRMRQKLRGPTGQAVYRRRKALVEPVWGTLKEQRGMRRFRLRGLEKVNIEFTLAAISFNHDQATGCTPLPRPANLAMAQLIAPKRSHAVSLAPVAALLSHRPARYVCAEHGVRPQQNPCLAELSFEINRNAKAENKKSQKLDEGVPRASDWRFRLVLLKALPPSLLPIIRSFLHCMPGSNPWGSRRSLPTMRHNSFVYRLISIFQSAGRDQAQRRRGTPNAIGSDSRASCSDIGNVSRSGMHFRPLCDKTSGTEWETLIAP